MHSRNNHLNKSSSLMLRREKISLHSEQFTGADTVSLVSGIFIKRFETLK